MAVKQMSAGPSALATEAGTSVAERRRIRDQLDKQQATEPGLIEEARQKVADARERLAETEYGKAMKAVLNAEADLQKLLHSCEVAAEQSRTRLWQSMKPKDLEVHRRFRQKLAKMQNDCSVKAAKAVADRQQEEYEECKRHMARIQRAIDKTADDIVKIQPDPGAYLHQARVEFFAEEGIDHHE
jgi:hypothetical protein